MSDTSLDPSVNSIPSIDPNHTPNLNAALAKAQGEFTTPKKTKTAKVVLREGKGSYEFKYADLSDILDATRAGLSKNGLSHAWRVIYSDRGPSIYEVSIRHGSGEVLRSVMPIPDTVLKSPRSQDFGSWRTFNSRYLLSGLLGVSSEEDDDSNLVAGNDSTTITRNDGTTFGNQTPPPPPVPKQTTARKQSSPPPPKPIQKKRDDDPVPPPDDSPLPGEEDIPPAGDSILDVLSQTSTADLNFALRADKGNTAENAERSITKEEADVLIAIAHDRGWSNDQLLQLIRRQYDVNRLGKLTAPQADSASRTVSAMSFDDWFKLNRTKGAR